MNEDGRDLLTEVIHGNLLILDNLDTDCWDYVSDFNGGVGAAINPKRTDADSAKFS